MSIPSPTFVDEVCAVIGARDFDAVESLRDGPVQQNLPALIGIYWALQNWEERDLLMHVIQDVDEPLLDPIVWHALYSPTAETRAIAVCHLRRDNSLFETFLRNQFVAADLVDAEIERFRASKT